MNGGRREADRVEDIFPVLEMIYTVQKSGAAFNTVPGTSLALNLTCRKAIRECQNQCF